MTRKSAVIKNVEDKALKELENLEKKEGKSKLDED